MKTIMAVSLLALLSFSASASDVLTASELDAVVAAHKARPAHMARAHNPKPKPAHVAKANNPEPQPAAVATANYPQAVPAVVAY